MQEQVPLYHVFEKIAMKKNRPKPEFLQISREGRLGHRGQAGNLRFRAARISDDDKDVF